jgi:hypothetical protein
MLPILLVFNWATLVLSHITLYNYYLLIVAEIEHILTSGLMVLVVGIMYIVAWTAAFATHGH